MTTIPKSNPGDCKFLVCALDTTVVWSLFIYWLLVVVECWMNLYDGDMVAMWATRTPVHSYYMYIYISLSDTQFFLMWIHTCMYFSVYV